MATRYKSVSIKKFGWKRVAKNFMRFGWTLSDATQHTETTTNVKYRGEVVGDSIEIKDESTTTTKVRMHLSFWRNSSDFENLIEIAPLELLFNLAFLLRRIIGFFLPLGYIVALGLLALGGDSALGEPLFMNIRPVR